MKARIVITAAALTMTLPLAAPLAHAAPPISSEHYSFVDEGNARDCGLRVHFEAHVQGHLAIREVPGSNGTAFLVQDNYRFTNVITNRDNGKWFMLRGQGVLKEKTATHIRGNIWEFVSIEAGQPFVVLDSDGNVVIRDRGMLKTRIVFDTLGDDEPGGVELDFELLADHGSHPGFYADFCDIANSLIG